jgi:hypothetical protein
VAFLPDRMTTATLSTEKLALAANGD